MNYFDDYKNNLVKLERKIREGVRFVPGFRQAFVEELSAHNQTEIKGSRHTALYKLLKEMKAELEIVEAKLYKHRGDDLIISVMSSYKNKLKLGLVQLEMIINQKIENVRDLNRRYSYFSALLESCRGIDAELIIHPERISKKLP